MLPSTLTIPEEASVIETDPLVKADPPGVRVKEPMTRPDPLTDATILGASVMPEARGAVEEETPVPNGTLLDRVVTPLKLEDVRKDEDDDCLLELLLLVMLDVSPKVELVFDDAAVPPVPSIDEEVALARENGAVASCAYAYNDNTVAVSRIGDFMMDLLSVQKSSAATCRTHKRTSNRMRQH